MDRRNFRIRAASTAVNTLTVPCNRSSMDALNNGHKDYLSESDFRRASGAKLVVEETPSGRYSAFGRIESGKRAVVLLNQDPHKAIIAKFKLGRDVEKPHCCDSRIYSPEATFRHNYDSAMLRSQTDRRLARLVGDSMRRSTLIAVALVVLLSPASICAPAQENNTVTLQEGGWYITANPAIGQISVSHEGLGMVLEHLEINVSDEQGIHALRGWLAKKSSSTRLLIQASNPTTGLAIGSRTQPAEDIQHCRRGCSDRRFAGLAGSYLGTSARPPGHPRELGWDNRSAGKLRWQYHAKSFHVAG